jgi:exodeoxyribonuclease VII small subunit
MTPDSAPPAGKTAAKASAKVSAKSPVPPASFEAALSRLEEIVRRLESSDVALEESMGLFEEGVSLARHCSELLTKAEKRIDVLIEREDGTYSLRPLDAPGVEEGQPRG